MIPDFFPRDRYYCVLDEQPDFLVPASAFGTFTALAEEAALIVNPRCWLGWHGPLPSALAAAADHETLFDCPWIIWVDDPDRAALWPYWLGPAYARLLEPLRAGDPCPADLPPEVEERLVMAGIVTTQDGAEHRRRAWAAASDACAAHAAAHGYVPLTGLLPPFHIGALRRYYRYHTRMGTFTFGDAQAPGRYVAYDEPATRFVHQQLTRTISDVLQRVVVPSYSYLALYQGGAELGPHTDREACEYTLSICIDATPDPHTHGAWPLQLMTAAGPVSVTQGIGDALLFRGREFTHWRDQLPLGYTSSSVLFHFVDG